MQARAVLSFEFWVLSLSCSDLAGFGTQSQYRLELWMLNLASSLAILKTQNPRLQTQNGPIAGHSTTLSGSARRASDIFSTLIRLVLPGILYGVPATIVRTSSGFAPRILVAASALSFTK
jgi:hypothetical protein